MTKKKVRLFCALALLVSAPAFAAVRMTPGDPGNPQGGPGPKGWNPNPNPSSTAPAPKWVNTGTSNNNSSTTTGTTTLPFNRAQKKAAKCARSAANNVKDPSCP